MVHPVGLLASRSNDLRVPLDRRSLDPRVPFQFPKRREAAPSTEDSPAAIGPRVCDHDARVRLTCAR
eukprot:2049065-Prymnesium_polylepis.1